MKPKNTKQTKQTTKKTAKPKQSASTTRKAIIGKKKFRPSKLQVIVASIVGLFAVTGAGYWVYSTYFMEDVNAGKCTSYKYAKGSVTARNGCVGYLQQLANGIGGTGAKLKVDGVYGVTTRNKINAIQKKYGITQDGQVGPNTWKKLCANSTDKTAYAKAGCGNSGGSSSSAAKGWMTLASGKKASITSGATVASGNKTFTYTAKMCKVYNDSSKTLRVKVQYTIDGITVASGSLGKYFKVSISGGEQSAKTLLRNGSSATVQSSARYTPSSTASANIGLVESGFDVISNTSVQAKVSNLKYCP